jgi:hypothetical protein
MGPTLVLRRWFLLACTVDSALFLITSTLVLLLILVLYVFVFFFGMRCRKAAAVMILCVTIDVIAEPVVEAIP